MTEGIISWAVEAIPVSGTRPGDRSAVDVAEGRTEPRAGEVRLSDDGEEPTEVRDTEERVFTKVKQQAASHAAEGTQSTKTEQNGGFQQRRVGREESVCVWRTFDMLNLWKK